ncbi:hypothetical protein GCM10010360_63720 [Streptomyces nogalater]
MGPRRHRTLISGMTLAALAVTSVSCAGEGESTPRHPSASAAPAEHTSKVPIPAVSASHDPHAATTSKAPNLSARDIRPIISDTSVTGNSEYSIPDGIAKGKTLAIAVNCQGSGKLRVSIEPAHISFPIACEKVIVPSLNEIRFSRKHSQASIKFTSSHEEKWAFAVGWDPNPPDRS